MSEELRSQRYDHNSDRKIWYRPKTSDEMVLNQIFGSRHYDLKKLKRWEGIHRWLKDLEVCRGKKPLIVDCGANIGASSVFLAMEHPNALIVAVEPESSNFGLLRRNTEGLNVSCIHAAIGSSPKLVHVEDPGIGHWGYRTDPDGKGEEVVVNTIPAIYRDYVRVGFVPFLVKVDIEGGEWDLFNLNTQWVNETPVLVVELHDWMLSGKRTSTPFLRCISNLDRDFVSIGENIFSISNNLLQF